MRLLKISNGLWGCVLSLLAALSLIYAYISFDAPYYLAIARDISNGLVPYKDISSLYAPLMMYLNSLIFLFFEDPDYNYFLFFQYAIIFSSAGLLYLLARKLNLNKQKSLFLSLFLILAILSSDGININLEVYLILCVFCSFWFLINKHFFLAGAFLSLSVLVKQYGVFNFIPFFLLIFYYHNFNKKNLIKFLIGASIPVILFLIYYVFINNVSFLELLDQLSGRGYGQKNVSRSRSLFTWLVGSKVFLLLLLPLLFLKIKPFKDKISGILILGIIVNLVPVLIQVFPHYFIITFPYIFMLFVRNERNINKKFIYISNISLMVICLLLFLRIFRYKDVYGEQLNNAEKYKNEYPEGSIVFLAGPIRYLYILNDYQNPVLEQVGYDYSFQPDDEFRENYEVIALE
ncbi:hypothetical protein [Gramella sp. MAR_2010_147]|uniref:hypothetical protein n=1 Tax=Gramella sp. MAR_2010_147 TaxID=1250205 RepID=UPI00087DECF2|nr:hypothetical protein [Gramella sp. MAR_2010_147]SDR69417.1 hypothetical protein SAMN04488553_0321 [Gramella sp. MAR_2010_147]